MSFNINLKELSQKESVKVEWKENGNDRNIVSSITKTITAFANDISNMGGGYVICGAKEVKDDYGFPKIQYTGLSVEKIKEIESKVLHHCRDYISPSIAPLVQELDNPEDFSTRILVFVVIADLSAHSYRDGETSRFYVRIGKETREARNGILQQLFESKRATEPFDKRPCINTDEKDIDLLLFRDCLNEMELTQKNKQLEDYLSDKEQIAEFIPPLLIKRGLDDLLYLRNFALFMFGKTKSISINFPDIFTILSIYKGIDRSEPDAERYTFNGSIIEQAKKTLNLLDTQIITNFDKNSNKPNKEKYPKKAVQEAIVNAIVHRDYEIAEPIRITFFFDRIEIRSPGTLHWGVDKAKFMNGKASPKWRNQSFAYLFNKLGLTQSEGQGIPTIFHTMKENGSPAPIFEIESDSVTCILKANPKFHGSVKNVKIC